jgi:hypothetical protein
MLIVGGWGILSRPFGEYPKGQQSFKLRGLVLKSDNIAYRGPTAVRILVDGL